MEFTDKQFKHQAAKIKAAIINITNNQARHLAIQKIQDIFREKAERLYRWADDRNVPADNNRAERELHTLKKRTSVVTIAFKCALDKLAEQPAIKPYNAIFSLDSS